MTSDAIHGVLAPVSDVDSLYRKFRTVFCIYMIIVFILQIVQYYFVPIGSDGITAWSFILFPIAGVYILWKKEHQMYMIADVGITFGVVIIIQEFWEAYLGSTLTYFFSGIIFGVLFIMASGSFMHKHFHSGSRMMALSIAYAIYTLIFLIEKVTTYGYVSKLFFLTHYFSDLSQIIFCALLVILVVNPEDFVQVRVSKQLKDVEYSTANKSMVYILEKDLNMILGIDKTEWHPSADPMVKEEVSIHTHGSRIPFEILARVWEGEEDIRLTLKSSSERTVSWGGGFRIIDIVDDDIQTTLGRVVRIYTDDGFFIRVVISKELPVERHKARSKLKKYFAED